MSTGRRQPGKLPQPRVILSDVMMIISDGPTRKMRESKRDGKIGKDENVGFCKKWKVMSVWLRQAWVV